MDMDTLNASFGIKDQVTFKTGNGGFPFIYVQSQHASAVISLYGGQILSFKLHDEPVDMLFLSRKASYEKGKAIRGGIPVCWPWFGIDPKGLHRPNHGFVRNQLWVVRGITSNSTETTISLGFSESQKDETTWKQPFSLTLEFKIGKILSLKLTTKNSGDKPFSITQAFHSYFHISDIRNVQVLGLEGCHYFDKLDQGREKQQRGIVTIGEEVDRIYQDIDNHVILEDSGFGRRVKIVSENCRTGVVWNPWQKAMDDLEEGDYQRFVCVESGNIAFDLVQVPPGSQVNLSTSYQIIKDL